MYNVLKDDRVCVCVQSCYPNDLTQVDHAEFYQHHSVAAFLRSYAPWHPRLYVVRNTHSVG